MWNNLGKFARNFTLSTVALIALFAAIFFYYFQIVSSPSEKNLEILADLLLIAGAWMIANGAVLSKRKRDFLFRLKDKPIDSYVGRGEYLDFKLDILTKLGASQIEIDDCKDEITKYRESKPMRFAQRDLAKILIDTSDKTGAGTVFIVAGTLILILKVMKPYFLHFS